MSLQIGNQNRHENQPIKLMTTPKAVFKYGRGHRSDFHIRLDFQFANTLKILCSDICTHSASL